MFTHYPVREHEIFLAAVLGPHGTGACAYTVLEDGRTITWSQAYHLCSDNQRVSYKKSLADYLQLTRAERAMLGGRIDLESSEGKRLLRKLELQGLYGLVETQTCKQPSRDFRKEELLVYALRQAYLLHEHRATVYVPCAPLVAALINPDSASDEKLRQELIMKSGPCVLKQTAWKIIPSSTDDPFWSFWPNHLTMYQAADKAATEKLGARDAIAITA